MLEYAILVGRAADRALLVKDRSRLPSTFAAPEAPIADLMPALEAAIGGPSTVLRLVQCRGEHDVPTFMAVELDDVDADPPDGHAWLALEDVDVERFEPPEVRVQVAYWLARQRNGPSARRPPWARPGWFGRASAWMTATMAKVGRPAAEGPRIHYLWSISAVLRASCADGTTMYMKQCAQVFPSEARVTDTLAARSPTDIVSVAAMEPDENWLLMADHGGRELGLEPPERWVAGLETFATIQQAWTDDLDLLIDAGATVRPLAELADGLPALLERAGMADRMATTDRHVVEAAIPDLVVACRRLEAIGPTAGLVHGDLHPWNVVVRESGPLVFDWSDVSVSHPFLDLAVFLRRVDDPALRRSIRDAYLARWTSVLPPDGLEEAGDLALVVGALFQVESYVAILESLDVEDRFDMAGADLDWLRYAVRLLRHGIDADVMA